MTAIGRPTSEPAGSHRWTNIASTTATARLNATLATVNPRCTSKYRAPRWTSTGTAMTRCLTTAYAKESGSNGNASNAHVTSQTGTPPPNSSATAIRSTGAVPVTVPHASTLALRRTREDSARVA